MADKKITQLNNITGADLADADEFVVVDITSDETKAITFNELKTAFDTGTGFVRVTGDTMTGALNVESTITSDGMIVDGDVTFGDNDKAIFGAGSDLQIYSDGTDGYIDNVTGDFYIRDTTGGTLHLQAKIGEEGIVIHDDGGVNLYRNNALKLATTSTGIDVTGNANFADNGKAVFGAGSDLQIYHDGSNSYIREDSVGSLRIQGADLELSNPSEIKWLKGYNNNRVELFFNNNLKLATTATGIDVTGTVTADSLTVDNAGTIQLTKNTTAAGDSLGIIEFHDEDGSATADAGKFQLQAFRGGDKDAPDFKLIGSDSTGVLRTRIQVGDNGDISFYEDTGTTAKFFWDASAESLTVGSTQLNYNATKVQTGSGTATSAGFNVFTSATGDGYLLFSDGNVGNQAYVGQVRYNHTDNFMALQTAGSERMRIDSSGNFGIGTTSPTFKLDVAGNARASYFALRTNESAPAETSFIYRPATGTLAFGTASAERMRIDSSGRVGIGTASPSSYNSKADDLVVATSSDTGISLVSGTSSEGALTFADGTTGGSPLMGRIRYSHSSNEMDFRVNNTQVMTIDSSGKVGIGTDSPSAPLTVKAPADAEAIHVVGRSDDIGQVKFLEADGTTEIGLIDARNSFFNIASIANIPLKFATNNSERMRIDASGNLLVGTTDSTIYNQSSVEGMVYRAGNSLDVTRASNQPLILNRLTTDGTIADFRKDGSVVGTIGNRDADDIFINTAGGTGSLSVGGTEYYAWSAGSIYPWTDNARDLGGASNRFDDIYATNGTIQTSDFNEKQDIASLTATEMLVGKRISALFKTFRWKDSVAENGDNARTHTGVIAQDVQAAFTAEGLDAGDYALFISSTWWEHDVDVPAVEAVAEVLDEDGNVTTEAVEAVDAYTRTDTYDTEAEAPEGATSKTRMGIRYPELLSFVAAYNEQRFASIEARLTALEG